MAKKQKMVSDNFDPLGSYTGTPADKNDKPIQDADDLQAIYSRNELYTFITKEPKGFKGSSST